MENHLTALDLSYRLPDGTELFGGVNFTFGAERTGLIGQNGVGKTTLLEVLSGRKRPFSGRAIQSGRISYLAQAISPQIDDSVATAIGIGHVIESLERIEAGRADSAEIANADGLWGLRESIDACFSRLGVRHISIYQPVSTLSGGEFMRVRIAGLLLEDPDFVLLDEPTNHLDYSAREFVYKLVASWSKGLVVVTHDRKLLGLVDQIAEMDSKGVTVYGGNFEFYREQRRVEQTAAEQSFAGARTRFKKVKRAAQLARERQQKRNSAGHKRALRTGISAMAAGNLRRAAEKSGARLADRHQKKVEDARQEVLTARAALSVQSKITVDLGSTLVSATRRMIEAAALNYSYAGSSSTLWSEPLQFLVSGPARIHLKGVNGSGKSTLIDLICGRKHPTEGIIRIADAGIGVLDQSVDVLDDSLSVLENLKRTTKDRADYELRILLGRFLFYHDAALKPAGVLSGGERMRAGLACLLAADQAPQILILDEPTNNLDLQSIESVASALREYAGTLIVVSHDVTFLQDIGTEQVFELSRNGLEGWNVGSFCSLPAQSM